MNESRVHVPKVEYLNPTAAYAHTLAPPRYLHFLQRPTMTECRSANFPKREAIANVSLKQTLAMQEHVRRDRLQLWRQTNPREEEAPLESGTFGEIAESSQVDLQQTWALGFLDHARTAAHGQNGHRQNAVPSRTIPFRIERHGARRRQHIRPCLYRTRADISLNRRDTAPAQPDPVASLKPLDPQDQQAATAGKNDAAEPGGTEGHLGQRCASDKSPCFDYQARSNSQKVLQTRGLASREANICNSRRHHHALQAETGRE
jgi:hypothetical protein